MVINMNCRFLIRIIIVGVLIFTAGLNFAETSQIPKMIEVSYQMAFNGKVQTDAPQTKLLCSSSASKSFTIDNRVLISKMAKEVSCVDYLGLNTYQIARFSDGKSIYTSQPFSKYPVLTDAKDSAVILGYSCKHLKTTLRSNTVDIWYTTDLGVKGTPSMGYGLPEGLVLKIVRNGNFEIVATAVKPIKGGDPIIPNEMGEYLDVSLYKHRITEHLVTTVNVFTDEQISFGNEFINPVDTASFKTFKYSSGTVILKKVKLPVISDDTQLFVEVYQRSNGDAYDRTGTVFMIPQDKELSFLDGLRKGVKSLPVYPTRDGKIYHGVSSTENFLPLVEIMRFFTPFGIGHFNEKSTVYGQSWADSTFYKQEVTDLLPILQGECWIGVFVGNYDKGGHKVSLKFKYYPGSMEVSDKPVKKYWTLPLFNTLNVMEMTGQEYGTMFGEDSLSVQINVPEGLKNVQMRYISTGHGGWGGGDEFNQKLNTVLLDSNILFQYTPWRCDCATFRNLNPASGNSWNGTTSSDYSRSGWCPGTSTNPIFYTLPVLAPGKHKITVAIPLGKNEGGSFSSWNVSGVLIGEYQ